MPLDCCLGHSGLVNLIHILSAPLLHKAVRSLASPDEYLQHNDGKIEIIGGDYNVASLSGVWGGSRVRSCLGGFCLALPSTRFGVLYSNTLSVRDRGGGLVPRPTGLLTMRVLVNSGSALPRVSTSLLVLRHLGLPVHSHTGSSQQSPAP